MIAISFNNRSLFFVLVVIYVVTLLFRVMSKKTDITLKNELKKIVFGVYCWMLISCTLLPILIPPMGSNDVEVNFNIATLFEYPDINIWICNVVGNILMFMPLYFCISMNFRRLSGKVMLIISLLTSVTIEGLQCIENITGLADFTFRITDINDVVLNVAGGMLGWWIYEKCKKRLK